MANGIPGWFREFMVRSVCHFDGNRLGRRGWAFYIEERSALALSLCQVEHINLVVGLLYPPTLNPGTEIEDVLSLWYDAQGEKFGLDCSFCKKRAFGSLDASNVTPGQALIRERCKYCGKLRYLPVQWYFRDPVPVSDGPGLTTNHVLDAHELLKAYIGNADGLFTKQLPAVPQVKVNR